MDGQTQSVLDITGLRPGHLGTTTAQRLAADHWRANLAAIASSQPDLASRIEHVNPSLQWVFGRDGYLTARDESAIDTSSTHASAAWWNGCSVPLLAGRELMKTLELTGNVGCFLCPEHAGWLRACFEKIRRNQGIIAIVPDLSVLAVLLRCDDFSAELTQRRLLFAAGSTWGTELAKVFKDFPGLPMPQQFIRTALMNETQLAEFTTEAQDIIAAEMNRRTQQIAVLRTVAELRPDRQNRVAVVAPSQMSLWSAAGTALALALCAKRAEDQAETFCRIDPDQPAQASPLAVAIAAAESDAVVTADVFRADFPALLADRTAWITWVTSPRIAAPDPAATADAILLADPAWRSAALAAGWNEDRIAIATWPALLAHSQSGKAGTVGLLIDTRSIEPPPRVTEYSSQLLLWELIEQDLSEKPFALGADPMEYLSRKRAKMGITEEGFDPQMFLDGLVLPAYYQGLARWLLKSGFSVALIGSGWNDLKEFTSIARGAIQCLDDLAPLLADCGVLVHPSPIGWAHPIESLGLPLAQPGNCSAPQFAANLKEILRRGSSPSRPRTPPISRECILSLIVAPLPPPPVFRGRIEEGVRQSAPPNQSTVSTGQKLPPPQPSPGNTGGGEMKGC